MANEVSFLGKLIPCRTCKSFYNCDENKYFKSLFSDDEHIKQITKQLNEWGMKVEEGDGLPTIICINCLFDFESVLKTRRMVETSYEAWSKTSLRLDIERLNIKKELNEIENVEEEQKLPPPDVYFLDDFGETPAAEVKIKFEHPQSAFMKEIHKHEQTHVDMVVCDSPAESCDTQYLDKEAEASNAEYMNQEDSASNEKYIGEEEEGADETNYIDEETETDGAEYINEEEEPSQADYIDDEETYDEQYIDEDAADYTNEDEGVAAEEYYNDDEYDSDDSIKVTAMWCVRCQENFPNREMLLEHAQICTMPFPEDMIFKAEPEEAEQADVENDNMKKDLEEEPNDVQDNVFQMPEERKDKKRKMHTCNFCGKEFRLQVQYNIHVKKHK